MPGTRCAGYPGLSVLLSIALLLILLPAAGHTAALNPYIGNYYATMSGADTGLLTLHVAGEGSITGVGWLGSEEAHFDVHKGKVSASGALRFYSALPQLKFHGTINSDGTITGEWLRLLDGKQGTFAGLKDNPFANTYYCDLTSGGTGIFSFDLMIDNTIQGKFAIKTPDPGASYYVNGLATTPFLYSGAAIPNPPFPTTLSYSGQLFSDCTTTGTWTDTALGVSGTYAGTIQPSTSIKIGGLRGELKDEPAGRSYAKFEAWISLGRPAISMFLPDDPPGSKPFQPTFDPLIHDVIIMIGAKADPVVLKIPAGGTGWKASKYGFSWASARGAAPAARVEVCPITSTRNGYVRAAITKATFPTPVVNPVNVFIRAGGFDGLSEGDWREFKDGTFVKYPP